MMRQEVIPYTTVSPLRGTNCSEDVDSTNVGQLEYTVSGVRLTRLLHYNLIEEDRLKQQISHVMGKTQEYMMDSQ